MLYKRLLDTGTEEARQRYTEAKLEVKKLVRKAKMKNGCSWGKNWRGLLGTIS